MQQLGPQQSPCLGLSGLLSLHCGPSTANPRPAQPRGPGECRPLRPQPSSLPAPQPSSLPADKAGRSRSPRLYCSNNYPGLQNPCGSLIGYGPWTLSQPAVSRNAQWDSRAQSQKREFITGTRCQQGLDFRSLNLRQGSEATQPRGLQD